MGFDLLIPPSDIDRGSRYVTGRGKGGKEGVMVGWGEGGNAAPTGYK